jgi:hypothetical protein
MSSFNNRFWGVKRLRPFSLDRSDLKTDVESYLDWRLVALEDTAILLCKPSAATRAASKDDLIILEGILMTTWLEYCSTGL